MRRMLIWELFQFRTSALPLDGVLGFLPTPWDWRCWWLSLFSIIRCCKYFNNDRWLWSWNSPCPFYYNYHPFWFPVTFTFSNLLFHVAQESSVLVLDAQHASHELHLGERQFYKQRIYSSNLSWHLKHKWILRSTVANTVWKCSIIEKQNLPRSTLYLFNLLSILKFLALGTKCNNTQ